MKILDVRDIDFNSLKMLDILSSEGSLYFDDDLFYKFYDNLTNFECKERKLIILNSCDNNFNAIIPHILIKNKLLTSGAAMKYVRDALSLIKYKNNDNYISLLYDVSMTLKKIHSDPRNIVVGDLHFNNILVDQNMKHYFIDFDSCRVSGIEEDRLPNSLLSYVKSRGNFDFDVNCNTDRFCMTLSFINSFFDKFIDMLSMYDYDEKAEQIHTLKNLREYVIEIRKAYDCIPYVPYLHEIISIEDLTNVKKLIK